jgi:WD40 repeat protein
LTFVESKKKMPEGKLNFFTIAGVGFDKIDGAEFIAVGTTSGEIYAVQVNGTNFTKDLGFQMSDESAITAISGDSKSKTLAVGNCNGYVIIFECDLQGDWKPLHSLVPSNEIPCTALQILNRGDNLYVAGFLNGLVKLISPNGSLVCELSAHSRCINAITCHPTKSLFATCSDDTFVHVFEVVGDTPWKRDVNLILSSRVNDY